MRIHKTLSLACLALLGACQSTAPEKTGTGTSASNADHRRIAAAMVELAEPGPEHARLMEHIGTWQVAIRSRLDQNSEWNEGRGTATYRGELDGRYLRGELQATIGGEAFHGITLFGFSRLEDTYTWVHLDSMSTWPMTASGGATTGGTIHLHGLIRDATTPQGRPFRLDNVRVSDNERYVEVFDSIDGELVKVMELREIRS